MNRISPFLLLLMLAFLGCEKFPPYSVTIKGRAETIDGKPLAKHFIKCEQTLFGRTTSTYTDANGQFIFNLTTSWDESSTDRFKVTGATQDSLMCISKEEITLLKKNDVAEMVLLFDKITEQKVRFTSLSNRLERITFEMGNYFMSNGQPGGIERFKIPTTYYGMNALNVNFQPIDTTISLTTGKNMKFSLVAGASLINPSEQKSLKAVTYNFKESRPDTMIVVRF